MTKTSDDITWLSVRPVFQQQGAERALFLALIYRVINSCGAVVMAALTSMM